MVKEISFERNRIIVESFEGGRSCAYLDEHGNIRVDTSNRKDETLKKGQGLIAKVLSTVFDFINSKCLLLFIAFFIGLTAYKDYQMLTSAQNEWFITYFILLKSLSILLIGFIILFRLTGKENLKNRGAMLMVLSAYNDLKRIPTVIEAKKYSRIDNGSWLMFFFTLFAFKLLAMLFLYVTGIYIPVIVLIPITIFSMMKYPMTVLERILQILTTSKPENRNLELAIAALKALII